MRTRPERPYTHDDSGAHGSQGGEQKITASVIYVLLLSVGVQVEIVCRLVR